MREGHVIGVSHPIHFHLVNFQVISRQPFDVEGYDGTPTFTGPERRPDLNEAGWKEAVRMDPGECTTVIMKFELPTTSFTVPDSKRTEVTNMYGTATSLNLKSMT